MGPLAVGLGLAAHLVSGGASPPAVVVVALAASVSLLAAAAARVSLAPWVLGVSSGLVQQALHLAFTALAGANAPLFHPSGHVHGAASGPELGSSVSAPVDLHLLVVVHVAAALVTAVATSAALRAAGRPRRARGQRRAPSTPSPAGAASPRGPRPAIWHAL